MHPFHNLPNELKRILDEVARVYELGEVLTHHSLGGLDALNEAIVTPKGTFVVKLFDPSKPRPEILEWVGFARKGLESRVDL